MPVPTVYFREAIPQEDNLIAQHFYQMWLDNNVVPESIDSDWLENTLEFIKRARQELHYKAFVAEVDRKVVGSASCQIFAGLYPIFFTENYRKYGYIWGVYVDSPYRSQGIAKQLTSMTIDYLKAIACTRVILHASPSGKPVYEHLGFVPSNEMRLDI
ncbi:GNAT family N-acetyltransferase [Fischerella thermalis CCMEE 5201]|jgi:ribosomal protein S18 acetylase RimI-like enzyme|nr:GNAT family N-acetyltransferase [Fischerella thermalis CCMEE 5201]